MAKKTITVQGTEIRLLTDSKDDYISLTDIDQKFEGNGRHIENWLRNQNTIEYLATWELLHNPNFNSMQLHGIKIRVVQKLPCCQILDGVLVSQPVFNVPAVALKLLVNVRQGDIVVFTIRQKPDFCSLNGYRFFCHVSF